MSGNQPVLDPKLLADNEAYARLAEHWAEILKELSCLDTEDQRNWTELTEFTPEAIRKSLGV